MGSPVLARAMTEQQLLEAVTDALTLYKWRWVHFRRSDKAQMMGHAGFPDVVAARHGFVLYLELKTAKGYLSPFQADWLVALGADKARVVRPDNLEAILEDLR